MKNIFTLIIVFSSLLLFSRDTTVSTKDHPLLRAYQDSVEAYQFGMWQAASIRKFMNYKSAKRFYDEGKRRQRALHLITPTIAIRIEPPIVLWVDIKQEGNIFYHYQTTWSVGVFKEPVNRVFYKAPTHYKHICMPSGKFMNATDFIAQYGYANYYKLFAIRY